MEHHVVTRPKPQELRACALALLFHAQSGHPGGVLSAADLLLEIWERSQPWMTQQRGRLVLSKGHSVAALYTLGGLYGMLRNHEGTTLRKVNSRLQGHGHVSTLPWLETSTGSLGQGFSFAVGLALGLRHCDDKTPVYAVLGDGELQEGQVWEAAMSASHFGLDRLIAVVDYNKLQSDASNEFIMRVEPLADKWSAFGWHVAEIDGHSEIEIAGAIDAALGFTAGPSVVIAHTVKGKGVSFMEDVPSWHGSVRMTEEQVRSAWDELGVSKERQEQFIEGRVWRTE